MVNLETFFSVIRLLVKCPRPCKKNLIHAFVKNPFHFKEQRTQAQRGEERGTTWGHSACSRKKRLKSKSSTPPFNTFVLFPNKVSHIMWMSGIMEFANLVLQVLPRLVVNWALNLLDTEWNWLGTHTNLKVEGGLLWQRKGISKSRRGPRECSGVCGYDSSKLCTCMWVSCWNSILHIIHAKETSKHKKASKVFTNLKKNYVCWLRLNKETTQVRMKSIGYFLCFVPRVVYTSPQLQHTFILHSHGVQLMAHYTSSAASYSRASASQTTGSFILAVSG